MGVIRYITHPNVAIEPDVPVAKWGLSSEGRRRAHAMLSQPWVRTIDRRHDQPSQGHYFTVEGVTGQVLHAWQPIDVVAGA